MTKVNPVHYCNIISFRKNYNAIFLNPFFLSVLRFTRDFNGELFYPEDKDLNAAFLHSPISLKSDFSCFFKENLQKPKKKKEEADRTTEAKLNGKEAKPKKVKSKKNEDASEDDIPSLQSEED